MFISMFSINSMLSRLWDKLKSIIYFDLKWISFGFIITTAEWQNHSFIFKAKLCIRRNDMSTIYSTNATTAIAAFSLEERLRGQVYSLHTYTYIPTEIEYCVKRREITANVFYGYEIKWNEREKKLSIQYRVCVICKTEQIF